MRSIAKKSLVAICLSATAIPLSAQICKAEHKGGIAMRISLAAGTIRTPPLEGKSKFYNIDIEARWALPAEEQRCAMGFAVSPSDTNCKQRPQLLKTAWKVFDGDRIVASGVDDGRSNGFDADKDALTRNIGSFRGQKKHTYIIELTFLKDASVLNLTQPCLLVDYPGFSF